MNQISVPTILQFLGSLLTLLSTVKSSPVIGWDRLLLSCDWLRPTSPLLWLAETEFASPVIGWDRLLLSYEYVSHAWRGRPQPKLYRRARHHHHPHHLLWLAETDFSSPVIGWDRLVLSCDWLMPDLPTPSRPLICNWLRRTCPLLWLADAWLADTELSSHL
jgi:hypothetical protein